MSLIERRIGLLFALFVLAFAVIIARAAWLQGVQGGELSADAQSQQTETVVVPGSRGEILDRNGTELAVSEDAATIFATPYQVKDPERTADKLAAALDADRDEILDALLDPDSGFAYVARKVDLPTAERGPADGPRRDRRPPRQPPDLPAGRARLAGDRLGRGRQPGPHRARGLARRTPCTAPTGEREIVRDALGKELERDTLAAADDRLRHPADDRRQPPGADRGRPREASRRSYQPEGRHRDRDGPADLGGAGAGQLPGGRSRPTRDRRRRPELSNRATGYTYEPGSTFKAFTVAGALEDHVVTPEHDLRPAPDDPGRRPRDRGVPPARPGDPQRRRHPRPVLERRRGQDRPRAERAEGPSASTTGCAASGSAARPGSTSRARSRASSRPRRVLGLDDGQPADRPGPLGDPDADGRRLRGDRQRRHPAPAAGDPRRAAASARPSPPASG